MENKKNIKSLTKALIQKINKDPLAVLKTLSQDDIAFIIQKANYAYHSEGKPVFTDDMFDTIKDYLASINPDHPILKSIGAAAGHGKKAKLPYYMGSLDKIKSDEKVLEKFKKEYKISYVVSDKLDGNSGLLVDNKIYTRGDGEVGQDISHLLPFIQHIPTGVVGSLAVRGEFIISKKDFAAHLVNKGANARNTVAGILNAKVPDMTVAKYIQFVAYELIEPIMQPAQQLEYLKKMGFKVVHNIQLKEDDLTTSHLSKILLERREKSEFEVDGIVVYHNAVHERINKENPKHAFAFKSIQTLEKAEVIVSKVEWNISKDGFYIPVVTFPAVQLSGVSIQKASGFNAKYIQDNKLGPGSRVVIIRSGDVIPYILETLSPSASGKPQMPEGEYEWTESGVDIFVKGKHENEEVILKNLQYFFDKIDIKGISGATIAKVYNAGYKTVSSIVGITIDDLLKIDGFKQKSAENFVKAMSERIAEVDCITMMDASNTLGRGMGRKKLEVIIHEFPGIIKDRYIPTIAELVAIKGIEVKTASLFRDNLPAYFKFIDTNKLVCTFAPDDDYSLAASLAGIVVVFTGFRNKEVEEYVTRNGGVVGSGVSKKTTVVVVKDMGAKESSKAEKAKELGIPIVTLEAFKKQINFS
jgi:NAD-dependent DNA ligase